MYKISEVISLIYLHIINEFGIYVLPPPIKFNHFNDLYKAVC